MGVERTTRTEYALNSIIVGAIFFSTRYSSRVPGYSSSLINGRFFWKSVPDTIFKNSTCSCGGHQLIGHSITHGMAVLQKPLVRRCLTHS